MIPTSANLTVYLALGYTDMRKAINGLSLMVESHLGLSPFSGHLFVFCSRSRKQIKILYWDRNGFCLWQKRLEKDRFFWPVKADEVSQVHGRELLWLLDGLKITKIHGHSILSYSAIN